MNTDSDTCAQRANLFRHVSTELAGNYRAVLDVFSAAKRQFRLHLRPDEIRTEAQWPGARPAIEQVQQLLGQLVEWGNLSAQADTARVASIDDYYRARFLYQLTHEGEAVESGMAAYARALNRRGQLQTVALEDIQTQLRALSRMAGTEPLDAAGIHQTLRDLVATFEGLASNAQDFMADLGRTLELQQADADTVVGYKQRLIEYLERFIGDLVAASASIAELVRTIEPADRLLEVAARREAHDAAPDDTAENEALARAMTLWRERWTGLHRWFLRGEHGSSHAEQLRARARAAIPRLLSAITRLNERRSGRSDRSADYRVLARWFAQAPSNDDAHRLWRVAFAVSPSRHLALLSEDADTAANTAWSEAPAIAIHPSLRERGRLPSAGGAPRIRDRSDERAYLSRQLAEEARQVEAARQRLATGTLSRLSEIGWLDRHAFALFLNLLAEALAAQQRPDQAVERDTSDGTLRIRLEPIANGASVQLATELGVFSGRDHRIRIQRTDQAERAA